MLSEEETKAIKSQLLKQIESFPEEQREIAREQIEAMNAEQLEQFLIKNKLIKTESGKQNECVFCLINEGKISAYKIDENKENLAILEINPASNGHALIIPKKHLTTDKISPKAFSLAKKTAKKIKSRLKAENVEISSSDFQGHAIINLVPIYKEMPKERKKASPEELKALQEKLTSKPRTLTRKSKQTKLEKAPRRVP